MPMTGTMRMTSMMPMSDTMATSKRPRRLRKRPQMPRLIELMQMPKPKPKPKPKPMNNERYLVAASAYLKRHQ